VLKGGKGNFGIVTALEFELVPVPSLFGGGLFFSGDDAPALLHRFREWAPTMPEEVGTSIAINSSKIHGHNPKELTAEQVAEVRRRLTRSGIDVGGASDEDIRQGMQQRAEAFRDNAPLSAAGAATIILNGVRNNEWRILVGDDALLLDSMVRATPLEAYQPDFIQRLHEQGALQLTGD